MFKRLVIVVSLVLPGLLAFAAVSLAAETKVGAPAPAGGKGGGPLPAGDYQFTTLRADAAFSGTDGSSITVFVTRSNSAFNPRVGPPSTTAETDVFVQIVGSTVDGSNCFVLTDPAAFQIGSDLRSASLQATLTADTPTCSGSGGPFPLPMTLNVQWSGSGVIATNRDAANYRCLTYGSSSTTMATDAPAGSSATITSDSIAGSFATGQSGLHASNQQLHAFGTVQPSCVFIV